MSEHRAHFRLAGIPVRVEPVFWIIVVMFGFGARTGWSLGLWVAIVFLSILLHELGHAVAYKLFGERSTITLTAFAGLTHGPRLASRGRRIAVSLAGPLTALLLVGLPAKYLLDGDFGHDLLFDVWRGRAWDGWYLALQDLVFVNVWWSIVNLLPIRPLDGGNVMTEIVGVSTARMVSIVVAVAAAVYAFSIGLGFAAFFAVMFAFMNWSEWRNSSDRGPGAPPRQRVAGLGIEPPRQHPRG